MNDTYHPQQSSQHSQPTQGELGADLFDTGISSDLDIDSITDEINNLLPTPRTIRQKVTANRQIAAAHAIMTGGKPVGSSNNQPTKEIMLRDITSTPQEVLDPVGDNEGYIAGLREAAYQNAPGHYDFAAAAVADPTNTELFSQTEGLKGPAAIVDMAKLISGPAKGREDLYEAVTDAYPAPAISTTGGPELLAAHDVDVKQMSIADIEKVVGARSDKMNLLEEFAFDIRAARAAATKLPRSEADVSPPKEPV